MPIKIKCPNGHVLSVKEKFAGRTGLCPVCKAKIQVPVPRTKMSEEDIAAMMGCPAYAPPGQEPDPSPDEQVRPSEEYVHQEPQHDEEGSGISLLGSSLVRRVKICCNCENIVSFSFKECPRCGGALRLLSERPPEAGMP